MPAQKLKFVLRHRPDLYVLIVMIFEDPSAKLIGDNDKRALFIRSQKGMDRAPCRAGLGRQNLVNPSQLEGP